MHNAQMKIQNETYLTTIYITKIGIKMRTVMRNVHGIQKTITIVSVF